MPIPISTLRQASRIELAQRAQSLNEAKLLGLRTAFLCHSHRDADLVRGLVRMLQREGWNIYVDWMDDTMPPVPDRVTAARAVRRHWRSLEN